MKLPTDEDAVFKITVVSEIVCMHPQTLRLYERKKIINPKRGPNKARFYSKNDIDKLIEIKRLRRETGINLKGIIMMFELEAENERLMKEIEGLKSKNNS